MVRYKKILGKMYESNEGTWILYKDHEDDYKRRWAARNEDVRVLILGQYELSRKNVKLKFSAYILASLLLLTLVF